MNAPSAAPPAGRAATVPGNARSRRPAGTRHRAVLGWSALLIVVLAVVLAALLLSRSRGAPLDPDNPQPSGAQAVARVLADHGVRVHPVRDPGSLDGAPGGPDTTLVVTHPENLSPSSLQQLLQHPAARLVLVDPDAYVVDQLDLPVVALGAVSGTASGACQVPALSGLRISGFDHTYRAADNSPYLSSGSPALPGCFTPPHALGQVLVQLAAGTRVTLVGSTDVLSNDTIRSADNAAIALRLLGHDRTLVWFAAAPSTQEASAGAPSVWPHWVGPAVVVVGFAVLLLILWRGRRLGRLVPEPLPVAVPANEITRSRGQLYRRARDTARATTILRRATRTRLTAYLGLPRDTPPAALVGAVARAGGRDPAEVAGLLFGPPPDGESAMTTIAQELQTLERQVGLKPTAAPDAVRPTATPPAAARSRPRTAARRWRSARPGRPR